MDIVRLRIPYPFLRRRIRLSWRDVRFGVVHELVDPTVPVALAVDRVVQSEAPSAELLELAGMGGKESAMDLVERLSGMEPPCDEEEVRHRWLYLVLAWIYDHRSEISDPLQRVEEVYADFGYPEEIAGFVRYMPMGGPDLGSREANERRLFERWKRYLDEMGERYAAS